MLHLSEIACIRAEIELDDRIIWINGEQLACITLLWSLAWMLNHFRRIPENVIDRSTFSGTFNN
jgi:hypothetical protein